MTQQVDVALVAPYLQKRRRIRRRSGGIRRDPWEVVLRHLVSLELWLNARKVSHTLIEAELKIASSPPLHRNERTTNVLFRWQSSI